MRILTKWWTRLALGAVFVGFSAGLAAAVAPAHVTTTGNVRAGPGIHFPVMFMVRAGSVVEVLECDLDWCRILVGGREGFMARALLAIAAAPRVPRVTVYPQYPPGPYYEYGPSHVYRSPDWHARRSWQGPSPNWQGPSPNWQSRSWQGQRPLAGPGNVAPRNNPPAQFQGPRPSTGTLTQGGAPAPQAKQQQNPLSGSGSGQQQQQTPQPGRL